VPREHPRVFGPRARLQALAKERPAAYQRVQAVARNAQAGDHERLLSMSLAYAIDGDAAPGRAAVDQALTTVNGPIRQGHVTFGSDLARCAVVYDLCWDQWRPDERNRFHGYVNATVDANVQSETHVFHNAWYGYKHWGYGVAAYASFHENPRAAEILAALEKDYRERAAPALEAAGAGGGWAEGYYIHYWLYEWLFFCEVARFCNGPDYYALAPSFYRNRAVAGMFETLPGIREYGSRRPVPMGDGGGRVFGGDRDKELTSRRILARAFAEQPDSAVVHAFDETTPRTSVGDYAYKDLLWGEAGLPLGDLRSFRLSHCSPGPGYVYARSSWDEDATYLFFRCGDRFTAHQHLDVGHFYLFKCEELAGDGGHYDTFGGAHDVNYHLRTIAHNTVTVLDPAETWPGIRAGQVTGNDGGQRHAWAHHNGAVADCAQWREQRQALDIADLLAFADPGPFVYTAGDATRAYSPAKLRGFVRQIVFLRPGTVVVLDQVQATRPEFRKTWLLQAAKVPERREPWLVVTNGKGRLFVQTLLPVQPEVRLVSGPDLYTVGGQGYPPSRDTGPAPECRIEVSPSAPREADTFLHVLTATDATIETVPVAAAREENGTLVVRAGEAEVRFALPGPGGSVRCDGRDWPLAVAPLRHPLEATAGR
jgi:hypothetical protein